MTAAPLVSVIVPTRDRPELVAGAVRSALSQDGVQLEVCVVDDGSADPVVLPEHLETDSRVTLIRLATSRGAAAARNAGVAATTGELVAFLDDDDVWLEGKLARQVALLRARGGGTAMVVCGFEAWEGRRLVASRLPPAQINSGALLAQPGVCPSTALVRRGALALAGGFDERLKRVEDWDLWLRLSDQGEIAVLGEALVDRRWNEVSPIVMRDARGVIAPRLGARLGRLAPSDAAPLRARWSFDDAVVLCTLGHRREAAAKLLESWRAHPSASRIALGFARVLLGERTWTVGARLGAPLRGRLRRRAPRPPGPAPVWADR